MITEHPWTLSAIKVLKDLIGEDPNGYTKADLYNYLGFATRKLSNPDYELAESYYLKALDINSNHIGAMEYLGELYNYLIASFEILALLVLISVVFFWIRRNILKIERFWKKYTQIMLQ